MAKQDNRRPKGDTGEAEIFTADMGINPPMDSEMPPTKAAKKSPKGSYTGNATTTMKEIFVPKNSSGKEAERTNSMGDAYKKGGSVKSASARADGCCVRGKTRA